MECPYCQSQKVNKRGFDSLQDGPLVQRYRCKDCSRCFNERTGTPMACLRTSSSIVSSAINARTEGMGVRAAGRTFGKFHTTIMRWQKRLAHQAENWSPPAPADSDVTIEGDEVARISPPQSVAGLDNPLH